MPMKDVPPHREPWPAAPIASEHRSDPFPGCAIRMCLSVERDTRLLDLRPIAQLLAILLLSPALAHAQVPAPARVWMPFSHLGVGATAGTTGLGAQIAVPYGAYWNLRAGVSYLGYSHTFHSSDGYPIEGHLRLAAAQAMVDWFPMAGGFHVSLGVLVPDLTRATARVALNANETITVNGAHYSTDSTNPLRGTGYVTVNKVAPLLTVGWGNLIPRDYHKRFSVPFEIGAAYQGAPIARVSISGDVCDQNRCTPVAANPSFNHNVEVVRSDLNRNLSAYGQFFPVISIGVGYRF
jgi:hypothetical protein